jgi:hypothetical protein
MHSALDDKVVAPAQKPVSRALEVGHQLNASVVDLMQADVSARYELMVRARRTKGRKRDH